LSNLKSKKNNMKKYIKSFTLIAFTTAIAFVGCKKAEYSFGEIKTPADLSLAATVVGISVTNPNGDGTGKVAIVATSTNVLSYNINYGDGITEVVPTGTITHKYSSPGTNEYTITVSAVGTGGSLSTISKKVKVFVDFEIPAAMLSNLTNGSSQVWVTDHDAPGHVGVGPATDFSPIWYAATPNTRDACLYDDEITFSKDANNKVTMSVDNKGQTFIIAAATAYYSLAGGDNCYNITTAPKPLAFMDATSASTSANSTRIQFVVPGNGIVNFATGGNTYEILSITATTMHLRNIGVDGNSWYQKLKVK
jgi:hypothetical protein